LLLLLLLLFVVFIAYCCLLLFLLSLLYHLLVVCRSEMHIPSVSVRFGLILEAYCRGNIEHLAPLTKQVDAIRCLGKLADIIKVSFCVFPFFQAFGYASAVKRCVVIDVLCWRPMM